MPDPMVEYRLYLPLAAVACLVAVALHVVLRRWPVLALLLGLGLASVLGGLTSRRLLVYRSAPALWLDAARVSPDNHRAYNNLFAEGPPIEALLQVLESRPEVVAHRLILLAFRVEQPPDVTEEWLRALVRDDPDLALARWLLAQELERRGAVDEALEHLRLAHAKFPGRGGVNWTLGRVLQLQGDPAGAERAYRSALAMLPNTPGINLQLGSLLLTHGSAWDALPALTAAVHTIPDLTKGGTPFTRLSPSDAVVARYLLGTCLVKLGGRLDLARMELLDARQLLAELDAEEAQVFEEDAPAFVYGSARPGELFLIGLLHARLGLPGLPARLECELGRVHEAQGALEQAVTAYREALRLDPQDEVARARLRSLGHER